MFNLERDSKVYPHLSPDDQARYRASLANCPEHLTPDDRWLLDEAYRQTMERFREVRKRFDDSGL